jgi:thiol-disulfide isomerase/thioredoxin
MKTVFAACAILAIALTLLVSAQSPAPADQPTTASGCLTATRAFQQTRMKEAGTPLVREKYDAILAETKAFAKACIAKLPLDTLPVAEQLPLANLYSESGQPDLAISTLQKALEASRANADEQGRLLVGMIRLVMRQPVSASRNAAAEKLADEAESLLPASLVRERIEVHGALNGYYRADDIDAGIIKHSTRIIELNKALTPEQRVPPLSNMLVAAYENLAEALAGQEQNAQALDALRRAPAELAGVAGVAERLRPTLERYQLVGTPGAAIEAPTWLNAPAGTTKVDMRGSVTWVQFTAHWCGPCRESYPAVGRMLQKFGSKGFRVVMATQFYGYFESRRNLAPADELAAITDYFPKHGIVVPIAVADDIPPVTENGRAIRKINVNDASYKVSGIPQIQLIDKKGNIRLIMIGFDEANEAKMAALIERLLKE